MGPVQYPVIPTPNPECRPTLAPTLLLISCINGSISGTVKDVHDNPFVGVLLTGLNSNMHAVLLTTLTDTNGYYISSNVVLPGDYEVQEANPSSFALAFMDGDSTPDDDFYDVDDNVDDKVGVILTPCENHDGNDFVVA